MDTGSHSSRPLASPQSRLKRGWGVKAVALSCSVAAGSPALGRLPWAHWPVLQTSCQGPFQVQEETQAHSRELSTATAEPQTGLNPPIFAF